MLTILNRRELFTTFDMKRQSEIRSLLAQNDIRYSIRVVNIKSPSPFSVGERARMGTAGENLKFQYEYTIYVHRSDYDRAVAVIGGGVQR